MTRVVHCKKEKYDIMIDRSTKWGNPFPLHDPKDEKQRQIVIDKYREWITQGKGKYLLDKLDELKGKTLGCWCKPRNCHGDILIELLKEDNE